MNRCADCGGAEIISDSEAFVDSGRPMLERSGYCNECGWVYSYVTPLQQFTDEQRARGIGPPLPADPFADTVLMPDPVSDV